MAKIYFDESGQTGSHLLDPEQPYFCVGSTDLEEGVASDILARCFPDRQGKELKSQRLLAQSRGRRQFLDFAKEMGRLPNRFCAAKLDKRFVVVSKMVDNLVEPILRAQGYDFYQDDYARRFANMTSFAFEHLLERSRADELLQLYNRFARKPDAETLGDLHRGLASTSSDAPEVCGPFLSLMTEGTASFARFHNLEHFDDTNDIHVTAVVQCMAHWQDRPSDIFEVVHDGSKHFFERSERWGKITNPGLPPTVVTVGFKTLTLPIRVVSTSGERSHESASLQVCDLIAGFVSRSARPDPKGEFRPFVLEAVEAGLGELTLFPVGPGDDFVSGPPARATGPDAIDRIVEATS